MQIWTTVAAAALGAAAGPLVPRAASWAAGVEVRPAAPVMTVPLTAVALAAVAAGVGWQWSLAAFLVLGLVAATLVLVDLRLHRLPDRLVLPSYVVGVVLLAAACLADGTWSRLGRAVAGAAVLLVLYAAMHLASGSGLGAGDVKYAGVLGLHLAWIGWPTLVIATVGGFVVGGFAGLALMTTGRAGRRSRLAFGPAMVVGALLAIGLGDAPARAVLGW